MTTPPSSRDHPDHCGMTWTPETRVAVDALLRDAGLGEDDDCFARRLEDEFAGTCAECGKSNYDCRCMLAEQQEAPPPCQTGSDGASRPERGQP